jgi:hypothetical protein
MAEQRGRLVPGTELTVEQALDLVPPALRDHIATLPETEVEKALEQLLQAQQLEYRQLSAQDIQQIKVGSLQGDAMYPSPDAPQRRSAQAPRSSMGSEPKIRTSPGTRSAMKCECVACHPHWVIVVTCSLQVCGHWCIRIKQWGGEPGWIRHC